MFEGPFDFVFTMFHRGIFASVLTVFISIGGPIAGLPLFADRPAYEPIPQTLVTERMRAEHAAAAEIGFGPPEATDLDVGVSRTRIEVDANTCVAVVAGTWGSHRVASLSLLPRGDRSGGSTARPISALSTDPTVEGLVASTQFCTERARSLEVSINSYVLDPMEPTASFGGVFTVQRAGADAVAGTLRRGWVQPPEPAVTTPSPADTDAGTAAGADAGPEAAEATVSPTAQH